MADDFGSSYTSYDDDDDSFNLGADDSWRPSLESSPQTAEFMEIEIDQARAECGSRVTGRARWGGSKNPRSVRVALIYKTEGRGNTDTGNVDSFELPPGATGDHGFELLVPIEGPMSYDGNLIRVVWDVELRLDLRARRDPTTEERIHVIPKQT